MLTTEIWKSDKIFKFGQVFGEDEAKIKRIFEMLNYNWHSHDVMVSKLDYRTIVNEVDSQSVLYTSDLVSHLILVNNEP